MFVEEKRSYGKIWLVRLVLTTAFVFLFLVCGGATAGEPAQELDMESILTEVRIQAKLLEKGSGRTWTWDKH